MPVAIVHFTLAEDDLVRRVDGRTDHPTVKPGGGRRVVNLVKRGMTPPDPGESASIARVLRVTSDEDQEDVVAFVLDWVSGGGGGGGGGVGKGWEGEEEEESEAKMQPSPLKKARSGGGCSQGSAADPIIL